MTDDLIITLVCRKCGKKSFALIKAEEMPCADGTPWNEEIIKIISDEVIQQNGFRIEVDKSNHITSICEACDDVPRIKTFYVYHEAKENRGIVVDAFTPKTARILGHKAFNSKEYQDSNIELYGQYIVPRRKLRVKLWDLGFASFPHQIEKIVGLWWG